MLAACSPISRYRPASRLESCAKRWPPSRHWNRHWKTIEIVLIIILIVEDQIKQRRPALTNSNNV